MSKASVGRPSNSDDQKSPVRDRLLLAAKKCFLEENYEKVSTRKIASEADTSIAMIRYYFGSKEGLYQELIRSQFIPIAARVQALQDSEDVTSLESFFKVYYETMLPDHQFPILMMRTLAMGQGPSRKFILENVVGPLRNSFRKVISRLQEKGKISKEFNVEMIGISMFSMAVMPMLAKSALEYQMGGTLDLEFYMKLAEHNARILTGGLA